ncbi:hypothetical protein L1049_017052 [Liquidambar formosana]|uniref:Uncharacterized protein n=1 Tax=Liquidambar formosana TaxID=63359 RepID=A0AAP0X769_LIQFO
MSVASPSLILYAYNPKSGCLLPLRLQASFSPVLAPAPRTSPAPVKLAPQPLTTATATHTSSFSHLEEATELAIVKKRQKLTGVSATVKLSTNLFVGELWWWLATVSYANGYTVAMPMVTAMMKIKKKNENKKLVELTFNVGEPLAVHDPKNLYFFVTHCSFVTRRTVSLGRKRVLLEREWGSFEEDGYH